LTKSLKSGAIVLVIAGFINRIIGFLYKILMVRLVGSEGIGLFQMVMPVFSFILVLTTAGIPPTISKLVSEYIALGKVQKAKKIFMVAILVLTFSSITLTIVSWLSAPFVVKNFFTDSRVYWAYLTLLPSVIIISFSSIFRGYFMGYKDMIPSAVSQIIETVMRFCIGLLSASYLYMFGLEFAIVGFSIGIVLGEIAGLVSLLLFYRKHKLHNILAKGSAIEILKRMYGLALPITINRVITTLVFSIHAIIIPMRFQDAGYTISEATSLYGQLSGIAYTVISLPSIVTVSLAITMVPAISEAQAANNDSLIRKRSSLALKYTLLAGIPWAVIFYVLPFHLTSFLFKSPEAGIPLKMLALGCIFIYLQQTTNGILQGLGKVSIILKNSLVGACINVGGVYLLTATSMGIQGTALALNISALIVTGLNLFSLIQITGCTFKLTKLSLLCLAALIMGIGIWYLEYLLDKYVGELQMLITVIVLGLVLYLIVLIIFGFISFKDIKRLPFIEDILRFISF
jgi:stage V sporulation protein B